MRFVYQFSSSRYCQTRWIKLEKQLRHCIKGESHKNTNQSVYNKAIRMIHEKFFLAWSTWKTRTIGVTMRKLALKKTPYSVLVWQIGNFIEGKTAHSVNPIIGIAMGSHHIYSFTFILPVWVQIDGGVTENTAGSTGCCREVGLGLSLSPKECPAGNHMPCHSRVCICVQLLLTILFGNVSGRVCNVCSHL